MCKTFEAIHKIGQKMKDEGKGDTIAVVLYHKKIIGKFTCCEECGCLDDVVTIKDAKIICLEDPSKKHEIAWVHVPSAHITAFTFNPCECGCNC